MYWIQGADGLPQGPFTAEGIRSKIAVGELTVGALARVDGAVDWRPISQLPDLVAVAPGFGGGAGELPKAPLPLDVGTCIEGAWALVKDNYGTFVLGALLLMVLQIAIGIVPFVGGIAQGLLSGVFQAGFAWMILRQARGEKAEVGDLFAGFQRNLGNLILEGLVSGLIIGAFMIPAIAAIGIGVLVGAKNNDPSIALIGVGVLLALAALPVVVYLAVSWAFSSLLVIDRQMGFWDAMKLSRATVGPLFWTVFLLLFLAALIGGAGVLACGVGVLFTMPIGSAVIVRGYERLFNGR